jgi:hypothetical protein
MAELTGTTPELPDSYYLETLELITPKNVVNIKSMMIEISYYEDIFRGSVTGEVLITDAISMIDRLGLSGGEYLNLVFRKTKSQDEKEGISKKFRIYRVSERILHNQETENYTLHFCSEEFFFSEQLKISKAYKGKKISEMATDVLVEQLQIPTTQLDIQETQGLYDFIIPYKSPFETLHWLANYAMANTYPGADFLFYENHTGFHFTSLQKLYTQVPYKGEKRGYMYTTRNLGNTGSSGELYRDLIGVKSYTYLDTFDTLYGTVNGAFASKTLTVDPLTRRYYETEFDYSKDYWLKNTQLNNFAVINNVPNRQRKTMNKMYDATYKVLISNKEQGKAKGISDKPWAVLNDIFAETYVPYRTAQMSLSHYMRVKIAVAGDPKLSVGKTINLELPSNASKKDGSGLNEGLYDVYNTGRYLISAVRHVIKADMKYDTVLEVVKDSTAAPIPDWNSPQIYEVVKGN